MQKALCVARNAYSTIKMLSNFVYGLAAGSLTLSSPSLPSRYRSLARVKHSGKFLNMTLEVHQKALSLSRTSWRTAKTSNTFRKTQRASKCPFQPSYFVTMHIQRTNVLQSWTMWKCQRSKSQADPLAQHSDDLASVPRLAKSLP